MTSIALAISIYPRTDERLKKQAYWFTIVCYIFAGPFALFCIASLVAVRR